MGVFSLLVLGIKINPYLYTYFLFYDFGSFNYAFDMGKGF